MLNFSITAVDMGGDKYSILGKRNTCHRSFSFQSPHVVAQQICKEDDGREEIIIPSNLNEKLCKKGL